MRGIDVSRWNATNPNNPKDLNAIAEATYKESDFVVVKSSGGTKYGYEDFFHTTIKRVLSDGKLGGAYHYAIGADPVAEADYFLSVVKPYLGKIILALDWEKGDNSAWGSTTWAKRFVDRVFERTGVVCFLYTGLDGSRQCRNLASFCPLWLAAYPPPQSNSWVVPTFKYRLAPWDGYTIWQFTSGLNKIDRNITDLTKAEWKAYSLTNAIITNEILVGSARIDENGNAHGGKSGDQGNEVAIEKWYRHSLGWIALRAKDYTTQQRIAYAMKRACENPNIGYDQYQRNTLYDLAREVGFDPGRVTHPCETDCSALVRVCLAYAGIYVNDFNTSTEKSVIMATGKFDEVSATKANAETGDILVTKTKGHTVVVVQGHTTITEEDEMQGLIKEPNVSKIYYYNIEAKVMWWIPNPECLALLKEEYKRAYGKDIQYMAESKFATLKKLIKGKSV